MNFNDRDEFAQHDFRHAMIEDVAMQLRRELILTICKLVWVNQLGHRSAPVQLRCGGVQNLDECLAFISAKIPLEMANLLVVSCKHNAVILKVMPEKSDKELLIECRNFSFPNL